MNASILFGPLEILILLILVFAVLTLFFRNSKTARWIVGISIAVILLIVLSVPVIRTVAVAGKSVAVAPRVAMRPNMSFGLLLILFVIGLIVLIFVRSKKAGPWLATVVGAIVVLFFLGFVLRLYPVKITNELVPQSWHSDALKSLDHTPAIWQPGIDDQFQADAYPSMLSAAKGLARQLPELFPTVTRDNKMPTTIQICGRVERDRITSELLNAAANEIRRQNDQLKVLVDTVDLRDRIQDAVMVKLSIVKWQLLRTQTGQLRSGTLSMYVTGPAGKFTRTIDFTEKTWVENFADYINRNPQNHWLLARSKSSCQSETEARAQAMQNACELIAPHVIKTKKSKPNSKILPDDILNHGFIVDRFAQSLQGSTSQIWREAILIDATPAKINALAQKFNQRQAQRRRTWLNQAGSLAAMLALICLVYVFLNFATKGYYTVALRIAMAILVIVGITILLFVR